MANPQIQVERNRRGWTYTLLATNGTALATSTNYTRHDNCIRGVRRFLTNVGARRGTVLENGVTTTVTNA